MTHAANINIDFVRKFLEQNQLGRYCDWLQRSSDITPMDFFLWLLFERTEQEKGYTRQDYRSNCSVVFQYLLPTDIGESVGEQVATVDFFRKIRTTQTEILRGSLTYLFSEYYRFEVSDG
ncbi:hypothetical protein CEXT_794071 [Caerostris extrusa]|uniref:Uncharacterized protein n=1 Tax=Caerostris extrusa TaxID=172846 RepID=A0AAV4RFY3_CAEEX|nr:hypothetical protein CEXT_794071 [Caerostris extrusa]